MDQFGSAVLTINRILEKKIRKKFSSSSLAVWPAIANIYTYKCIRAKSFIIQIAICFSKVEDEKEKELDEKTKEKIKNYYKTPSSPCFFVHPNTKVKIHFYYSFVKSSSSNDYNFISASLSKHFSVNKIEYSYGRCSRVHLFGGFS